MTDAHGPHLLRQIRRLVADSQTALPDGDLLRGYLDRRDEAAFAALVERHGPMVLGVCRAVLGHRHDAEDAFQAAFLVLARKADHIRRRDSVGSWLHAVAYRLALRARMAAVRRNAVEADAARTAVASADDLTWGEVRTILHEELAALSQRYREPLVLCYLQGLTQDEAANRLGWTAATLKGRLQRGREVLRRRLERRGLGLSAALGPLGLADHALAVPVPAPLAEAATRSAFAPANAAVVALARGSLTPPVRLWALAVAVLVGSLTAGFAFCLHQPAEPAAQAAVGEPVAVAAVPVGTDLHGDPLPDGAVARLGTVRFNHGDGLNGLYFLDDGKTILSEGNGFLRFWDAATGKELRQHATSKMSFDDQTVLSPDGKTLTLLNQEIFTTPGCTDVVRVWDLARGKETSMVRLPVPRMGIAGHHRNALSPDGRLCALHVYKHIYVFETATAKELWKLPYWGNDVLSLTFAGNDRLLTAEKKQTVRVWEARTGKPVREFDHGPPVGTLVASADGCYLATLEHPARDGVLYQSEKDVIHVWDLASGARKHTLAAPPKSCLKHVQFAPDGKNLFAVSLGQEHKLTMWDVATGRQVHEFSGAIASALAVSPDGSRLAEGYGSKFYLWDLKTGRRLSPEDNRYSQSLALFLSPSGDRAFTVVDSTANAWDGQTGRRLHADALPPYPFAMPPRQRSSPEGRYFLALEGDHKNPQLLVWDIATRRRLHTLQPPDTNWQLTAAFAPDSSLLATGTATLTERERINETVLCLWDLRSGKKVRSFTDVKAGRPRLLFLSADGRTLFVVGERVIGYDPADGKELFAWRPEPLPSSVVVSTASAAKAAKAFSTLFPWRALAVSSQGKVVACILNGGDMGTTRQTDRMALCEARTGRILRRWSDVGQYTVSNVQIEFSPDDRLLASTEGDVAHLWEVATGQEIRTLRGHRGEVRTLSFSANGRRLATASTDTTVLLWDLAFPLRNARSSSEPPGEKALTAWWDDLAGVDATRAYSAVWRLAGAPSASVPFLRRHVKPTTDAQVRELRQMVVDLQSDTFEKRERAARQLPSWGPFIAPALYEALEKNPALEGRRRLEQVLDEVRNRPASGEPLRQARAVAALEHAGTPEARRLLRELAGGVAGAWLTEEANAACERLERRPAP
jgi:RNA polymerase sigma factor (sigma-70 family)